MYVVATFCLALAWLCQMHVIFPIEQTLRGENSAVVAFSYVFLPHGAKVLTAVTLMQGGLPAIFLVSLGFGVLFGNSFEYAFLGSLIAALTALLPLWIINLTMRRPMNFRIWNLSQDNFSLFRFAFAVSLAVALLNSIFQSALAREMLGIEPDWPLVVGFLAGDIIGGAVCILLMIFLARFLMRRFGNVF